MCVCVVRVVRGACVCVCVCVCVSTNFHVNRIRSKMLSVLCANTRGNEAWYLWIPPALSSGTNLNFPSSFSCYKSEQNCGPSSIPVEIGA